MTRVARFQPAIIAARSGWAARTATTRNVAELSESDGSVVSVQQVKARTAHEIPSRPPIRLEVGDEVQVSARDSDWSEFVFVTAPQGTGWVPARHLSQPSGRATVRAAYDTTELPTRPGEVLEVIAEDVVSGWLWCRSSSDRRGWVPVRTVEKGS